MKMLKMAGLLITIALTFAFAKNSEIKNGFTEISSEQATSAENGERIINQNISVKALNGEIELKSEKANWDTRLPWIVAAIISFVTLLISIWQAKKNEKQSKETSDLANEQLKKTVEIAKEQISVDLSIASHTLNSQVLSKNRQDWINELRELIAQFLAAVTDFRSEWANQKNHGDKYVENELTHALKTKMNYTAYKIDLLLNPDEDETKKVYFELETIKRVLMLKDAKELSNSINKLKSVIKKILKTEWIRVKECR